MYIIYQKIKNFEYNLDYLGFKVLILTLFPTSLGSFSPASLLKLSDIEDLRHNPITLKHNQDYMNDYVYIIYACVNFLDEPSVIICLSCNLGSMAIVARPGVREHQFRQSSNRIPKRTITWFVIVTEEL